MNANRPHSPENIDDNNDEDDIEYQSNYLPKHPNSSTSNEDRSHAYGTGPHRSVACQSKTAGQSLIVLVVVSVVRLLISEL